MLVDGEVCLGLDTFAVDKQVERHFAFAPASVADAAFQFIDSTVESFLLGGRVRAEGRADLLDAGEVVPLNSGFLKEARRADQATEKSRLARSEGSWKARRPSQRLEERWEAPAFLA